MLRTKKKNFWKEMDLIGVGGAGSGTGTTHTVCLLANYLWGVRRIKTAAVQRTGSLDFQKIGKACLGKSGGSEAFSMMGVDYYPAVEDEELMGSIRGRYGCTAADYGNILEGGRRTEFLCCKKKLLVVSLCEWQMEDLGKFLTMYKGRWEDITILMVFGSDDMRKEAERRLKRNVIRIPFSPDPFVITGELITFFQNI